MADHQRVAVVSEAFSIPTLWPKIIILLNTTSQLITKDSHLKLKQFIRILSILDHSAKDENSRSVDNEAISSTPGRNVAFCCGHIPLIGDCK